MDENCNERGPSQLADVTHIVHVWGKCSECGELRGREEVARDKV